LKQGKNTVEEYYRELQIGMLRCGLEETPEAKMARFFGGLNREIQTILDYKEYNSITRLFHLACKAEREVQDRQRTRGPSGVIPTGWPNQRQAKTSATSSSRTPAPSFSNNRVQSTSSTTPTRAPEASKSPAPAPAPSSSSVNSTGRSQDTQCHRCKGYGHMMRDCPSKRALLIKDNGEYTSASDIEEEYTMLATDPVGNHHDNEEEEEEEQYGAESSDKYLSLIVQRVLSVQMEQAEQSQRHNLFQTKFIINNRSCRVIIDGGSCNNLASMDMVEKLGLTTKQHPRPYYIQWFNSCGKLKVTRIVSVGV
jgi:hypothetical protein